MNVLVRIFKLSVMGSQILKAFFKEAVSRVSKENYSETNKSIDLLRCICQKNMTDNNFDVWSHSKMLILTAFLVKNQNFD